MILAFIPYIILKYRSKQAIIKSTKLEVQNKSKLNLNLIHTSIFKKFNIPV